MDVAQAASIFAQTTEPSIPKLYLSSNHVNTTKHTNHDPTLQSHPYPTIPNMNKRILITPLHEEFIKGGGGGAQMTTTGVTSPQTLSVTVPSPCASGQALFLT